MIDVSVAVLAAGETEYDKGGAYPYLFNLNPFARRIT